MTTILILSVLLATLTWSTKTNWRKWYIQALRAQLLACLYGLLILLLLLLISDSHYLLKIIVGMYLLSAITYSIIKIFPFTPFSPREVVGASTGDDAIICISANVRMKNKDYGRLVALVQQFDPDLLLLTEVDQKWIDGIVEIETSYPHRISVPMDNTYGMCFYCKYELGDQMVRFLVDEEVPSILCTIKGYGKEDIRFIGLHPRPPVPTE